MLKVIKFKSKKRFLFTVEGMDIPGGIDMDFGKKLYCGNFVVTKKSRSLSKQELKELRDKEGIREDVRKHLTRGSLPYICVETVGGGWKVEFGIGTTMFEAIDALGMVRDEKGDWRTHGTEGQNAEAIFTGMFVDTTVVGDAEYQTAKMKAMSEYIERNTKQDKE